MANLNDLLAVLIQKTTAREIEWKPGDQSSWSLRLKSTFLTLRLNLQDEHVLEVTSGDGEAEVFTSDEISNLVEAVQQQTDSQLIVNVLRDLGA